MRIYLLAAKLKTNYVQGDELELFRDSVAAVYDYFVQENYFTLEEVAEARRVARQKD